VACKPRTAEDLVTSSLVPISVMIGTLAVATSARLAAVYLAADAGRFRENVLEREFRLGALCSGGVSMIFVKRQRRGFRGFRCWVVGRAACRGAWRR